MAKYKDQFGNVIEVGDASLNPELVKGKTLVSGDTPLGGGEISNMKYYKNSEYGPQLETLPYKGGYDYNPLVPLGTSSLAPVPYANFQSPSAPSPFNFDGLSPIVKSTDDLFRRTQELNKSLLGESAFRSEQEKAFGLSDLEATQEDLAAQIRGFQNQAKALQNQFNFTIPNQMQVQSEGRGITSGGLAPIQAGELRKNQIQQGMIATQALTASAALDAVNGKLVTAQRKIDQAVRQKYDPIREEIAVNKANLDLILNSPEYSREEKKRAQVQKYAQTARENALDAEIKEVEGARKIAIGIIPLNKGIDSVTIDRLMNAKTATEVFQIAQEKGLVQSKPDTSFGQGSIEEFKYLYGRDPKNVQELNAFTASRGAAARTPEKAGKTFETYTYGGDIYQYEVDETGKMIGTPQKISAGGTQFGAPSAADQSTAKNWLLLQPGFSQSDLQKLETDPGFFAWVLQQAQ